MREIIAIDIGGTNIKYGTVLEDGSLKDTGIISTQNYKGREKLLSKLGNIIDGQLAKTHEVIGIGISTAGQVNSKKGSITFATDALPGWTGTEVKEILEQRFNLPTYVNNDVNAALLGEFWQGAAKGRDDVLMITLGTGVGGGIIRNKEIYYGSRYLAGEFGHIKLYPKGRPCVCGQEGCYEQYASTSALVRLVEEGLETNGDSLLHSYDEINGKTIFEAEQRGDTLANELIEKWIFYISWGLVSLIHSLNPSIIIIGGGVSAEGRALTDRIKDKTLSMTIPSFGEELDIVPATLGNDAGLMGAAYFAKRQMEI